jgi:transcriptional regulator of acetoin/glycerol metabolism
LKALEVRRSDVRPLLAWFENQGASSATIIVEDEGPIGFILLPKGERHSPLTLEEAEGVRLLADRISAVLAVSSALARSRQRELEMRQQTSKLAMERDQLRAQADSRAGRHHAQVEYLEKRLRMTAYSPAARLTLAALERRHDGRTGLCLITPVGVDPLPWAAVSHQSGPNAKGPFIVVDGAWLARASLPLFSAPERSPWFAAQGGTLVLTALSALPHAHQAELVEQWTAALQSDVGSEVQVIVCLNEPLEHAASQGRVDRALAQRLGRREITLPTLSERSEDLRALIFEELLRAGLAHKETPIGIEPRALGLLMEHPWPGNEVELSDIIARAAQVREKHWITQGSLSAIGFEPIDVPLPNDVWRDSDRPPGSSSYPPSSEHPDLSPASNAPSERSAAASERPSVSPRRRRRRAPRRRSKLD